MKLVYLTLEKKPCLVPARRRKIQEYACRARPLLSPLSQAGSILLTTIKEDG